MTNGGEGGSSPPRGSACTRARARMCVCLTVAGICYQGCTGVANQPWLHSLIGLLQFGELYPPPRTASTRLLAIKNHHITEQQENHTGAATVSSCHRSERSALCEYEH